MVVETPGAALLFPRGYSRGVSARSRVLAGVLLAAAAAAAVTVGLVKLTSRGETTAAQAAPAPKPRAGAPPLALDLGVRTDREARALRQAQSLYAAKRYADAARIFLRYGSVEAQVGAALASWTRDRSSAWAHLQAIAREHPRSALVQFHVGGALYYLSRPADAERAWRKALAAQPDTQSAIDAETFLHPALAPGRPLFVPSFPAPARLSKLAAPAQVAALERAARRPDVHAKILYGVALQRLGHFVSAEKAVRGRRAAGARRPGGARRGRRRQVHEGGAAGRVLAPRPALQALPEGADRALPPGPDADLARPSGTAAGAPRTGARAGPGAPVAARPGSEPLPFASWKSLGRS